MIALYAVLITMQPSGLEQTPVLTLSGDPATSISINWRTKDSKSSDLQWWPVGGQPKKATATSKAVDLGEGGKWIYHTVHLKGLSPNKRYRYSVAGIGPREFKTADTKGPVEFLYFGDVQTNIGRVFPPTMAMAFEKMPEPDFMVFAGDLIDSAHSDDEWKQFFSPGVRFFGTTPSIATPGNHEYRRLPGTSSGVAALSLQWRPQFEFPMNGPSGADLNLEEQTFYVDYQGVRIVSLNSNRKLEAQAAWFDQLMTENPVDWCFVTYHHPVYSQAKGRDNPKVKELWDPLFRKHGVAVALQGHDHTYGRRTVKNVKGGDLVYMVSVVGSKMYNLSDEARKLGDKTAEKTRTFQTIRVNGDKLEYQSFKVDGTLFDSFTMVRQSNGLLKRQ